ncbi:MAG: response regulator [Rhodothermaceae bacterium]|nr:response regulator [Rhodothermaceae bacterium]
MDDWDLFYQVIENEAKIGFWKVDLVAGTIFWSDRVFTIHGVTPEQYTPELASAIAFYHPEDQPIVQKAVDEAIERQEPFDFELRLVQKDEYESVRWVRSKGRVKIGPDGKPVSLFGIFEDISEQKAYEQQMEILLSGAQIGLWDWDLQADCMSINDKAWQILKGLPGTENKPITSQQFKDRIHPLDQDRISSELNKAFGCDNFVYDVEFRYLNKINEYQWIRTLGKVIERKADHSPRRMLGQMIDISESKKIQEELKHALRLAEKNAQKAEEASRYKGEFLATMSHEIRTPMNGVIGMTSLLSDSELSLEQQEYVDIIRTSGESLLTIINDILDFSKIDAGKLILEKHPFDIRSCVSDAIDLVVPLASPKGVELLYYIDPNVPTTIISDSTRVRQVLVNLLSNAIKFTDEGEIFVSVSSLPKNENTYSIGFSVMDTGIGIPQDQLDSLFDAFTQVDASTTRKYGGTGLGLAISTQLAQLLGGGLSVESELGVGSTIKLNIVAVGRSVQIKPKFNQLTGKCALIVVNNDSNRKIISSLLHAWGMESVTASMGQKAHEVIENTKPDVAIIDYKLSGMNGATFAMALQEHANISAIPLIMLSPMGDRPIDSISTVKHWLPKPAKPEQLYKCLLSILGNDQDIPYQATGNGAFSADLFKSTRVLLADDNRINQKVALRMLDHLGCRVDAVSNGKEVLHSINIVRYDIILIDLMMPEMDGFEAARKIRKMPDVQQPVIIALTSNTVNDDLEKCMEAGMDNCLHKPLNKEKLHKMLTHYVEAHALPSTPLLTSA